VVFMVDSADTDRLQEARQELARLIDESVDTSQLPLLILANKSDLKEALSAEAIYKALDVASVKGPAQVFSCSVVKGTGYTEGFQWLATQV